MPPRLGLFELTWNVLCPGCGGVLDAHSTLKSLRHDDYHCGLCACGYEASVDEQVEVAFTVSPRVRRIAAHDPQHAADLGVFQADLLEFRRRFRRGIASTSLPMRSCSTRWNCRPARRR